MTGVIARAPVSSAGAGPGWEEALEICPGDRLRPCSGVRVAGEVAPELISTPGRVVVARVSGRFDGASLALDGPGERVLSPELELRNPCPQFQQARSGDVNPSPALEALRAEIEREHAGRHAATLWDRERQTLTVRLTGDTSELAARLRLGTRRERLCLVGGARRSQGEQRAVLDAITSRLTRRGVLLVSGGADVMTDELVLTIENVDRAIVDEIRELAGPGARIMSFIELLEGSLRELPAPPARGDIPLVTEPRRWSYVSMHARGHFRIAFDPAARCVYLDTGSERLLPVWPHGYTAYENPFRIVDFDGAVVSKAPERQPLGGGQVSLDGSLRVENTCGATSVWVGYPSH